MVHTAVRDGLGLYEGTYVPITAADACPHGSWQTDDLSPAIAWMLFSIRADRQVSQSDAIFRLPWSNRK